MKTDATDFGRLRDLADGETVNPTTHGIIEVIDGSGDTKKLWDRNNEDEVADARASFERLTKKGHAAFYVEQKGGKQAGRMKDFDPEAEGMILVPQIQGGR